MNNRKANSMYFNKRNMTPWVTSLDKSSEKGQSI